MKKIKGWYETKIDGKTIESGECEDRVLTDEEAAEELGEGYKTA